MKFAILIFNDPASKNVEKYLTDLPSNAFIHHVNFPKEHTCVYCENIDTEVNADIFLFITTHSSASGIKSLSLHTQGNWGKAELGGREKTLAIAPALYLKEAFKKMTELCDLKGFDVIQECTHHGPFIKKPSIFIEIGSSPTEWSISEAGKINAEIIKHIVNFNPVIFRTAVGLGGPHHAPNFKKIQLNTNIAIGHVCPKYMLDNLDKEMLKQALDKTMPKSDLIIADWKGIGEHKEKIKTLAKELGIEIKKTKEF